VESILSDRGFGADSLTAVSFSTQVATFEAGERMLAAMEIRRNNALHEIEDRRRRMAVTISG
jgi:hypothetical protein